ncbi:MAG TPA: hypothetical protein PLV59_01365 [Candidatus Dojkabacteria bacterium]|nr:hypothetical protein [Candidatus Dojkabacteria bacterium]
MNALVENFKTQKGTSYGVAGNLDFYSVDIFLQEQGYVVDKVFSKGRYYILKVSRGGVPSVFKMSTSEGINEALLNEKSWNEAMHPRVQESEFLRIPQVIDSGSFNGFTYIITSFFEGDRYVDIIKNGNKEGLEAIIKSNLQIDSIKDVKTYKNTVEDQMGKSFSSVKERAESYITVAQNFVKEVNGYELSPLLDLLKGYEQMDSLGLNHNEFEPYNFIFHKGKVCLYHGERASARSPRFFDVAVMYSKLYYTYSLPNLAKQYLSLFVDNLSEDRDYFKFAFKLMLSSRVIGGYWDYARNYENSIEMLEKVKGDILNDRIFKF